MPLLAVLEILRAGLAAGADAGGGRPGKELGV